jgi:hypothetical protein
MQTTRDRTVKTRIPNALLIAHFQIFSGHLQDANSDVSRDSVVQSMPNNCLLTSISVSRKSVQIIDVQSKANGCQ